MTQTQIVGVVPWLPWPLNRWQWLTQPVRAERLAAMRIGAGLLLLVDILANYLPNLSLFYGPDGLAQPDVFDEVFTLPNWNWSVLRILPPSGGPEVALGIWFLAAVCLTLGVRAQLAAAVAFVLSVSFERACPPIHNTGDIVRSVNLFFLALTPCAAVWSLSSRWARTRATLWVSPWAIRLMFVQLVVIYYWNGVNKIIGSEWRSGTMLHYVHHDFIWSNISPGYIPLPLWFSVGLTYLTLVWELAFPLLVLQRTFRKLGLLIGAGFHLMTFVFMQVGLFPFDMLVMYLPFVAWEKVMRNSSVETIASDRPEEPAIRQPISMNK